jgi:hypothetical protein
VFSVSGIYFVLLCQKSLKTVVFQKQEPFLSSPNIQENITENDGCPHKYKRVNIAVKERLKTLDTC